MRTGSALAVAQGYAVSLERLRLWAEGKGLGLAPISALLIERSGLVGRGRHGETPGPSQG